MLSFIIVITIIVFIHELGHYLLARINRVKIEKFAIGFGKEIIGFTDKLDTRWSINIIPIGGYVKLYGHNIIRELNNHELNTKNSFDHKSTLAKISVISAGPIANILLAIILFFFIFAIHGKYQFNPKTIQINKSLLQNIGLKPGEILVKIDNKEINSWQLVQDIIKDKPDNSNIDITIRNTEGARQNRIIKKEAFSYLDENGTKHHFTDLDLSIFTPIKISLTYTEAMLTSVKKVGEIVKMMAYSIVNMIIGNEDLGQLGSVISIAKWSTHFMNEGIFALISYIAVLSINLAFVNILPIPGLDGGYIILYLIEHIKGKPLSTSTIKTIMLTGYLILISIMIFSILNDLFKIAI